MRSIVLGALPEVTNLFPLMWLINALKSVLSSFLWLSELTSLKRAWEWAGLVSKAHFHCLNE